MSNLNSEITRFEIFGWSCCLLVPGFMLYLLGSTNLTWGAINFIVVFFCALMMWIFRLVPEYVPAVFIILATILLGLAPESILLSGFSSDSFFLAMSVFGLGAVVVKSGVFYRISLLIFLHLPKRVFLLQGVIFLIGAILTPLLSAQSSRVSLMAPFLDDLKRSANFDSKSPLANSLVCCAFQGTILLSGAFLTGKSSNFVLYGMLSKQMQWQFGWVHWLIAASFPALLLIIFFFIGLKIQFKVPKKMEIDMGRIESELSALGRMSIEELMASAGCLVLFLGLLTSSIHHISSAWLCFLVFFVLLILGVLDKKEFKLGINWPFLFYLGALIGIMRCVQVMEIDDWFIGYLSWLEDIADYSDVLFLMVIYLFGWLGSFLLGTMAAPALLFTMLLPMADHAGVNTWLIAFVLLISTEGWIFPYQSSYYLCFEELITTKYTYQLQPVLKMNAYFSLIRFIVIMLSIPVWQFMELL